MTPDADPGQGQAQLPLEAWGRRLLASLQRRSDRTAFGRFAFEFLMFGLKQGWACVFGALMLGLLFTTHLLWPSHAPIARYDAVFLAAVVIQFAMLALKLEDMREARAILIFHLVGTGMELFKTAHGSWSYPEAGLIRLGNVPLFSGFMYASVGSFIARIWRIQYLRFSRYPPVWETWALAVAIYANFFLDHYGIDLRWGLFAATAWVFRHTWIVFRPDRIDRRMPLLVALVLTALFIWLAENFATFSHAWLYPAQRHGWTMVGPEKLGSWVLLAIISFVLVTLVRRPEAPGSA
ncbi:DUF817 domain-containing protein [soil metagenome]